ncbi:MAG TPA: ABC transporter permease [Bryobacteraceae bacterium]|nr:ABC transporter permease [Bryobacteraceae bacterium]
MAIPLAYNLRNLTIRKTTTLMTALGIALTVAVLVAILALVNGLQGAFRTSGNPLNVLVMRKGANAELSGGMTLEAFQTLKSKPGIARGADGQPQASLELVTVINLPNESHPDGMNITLRGVTQVGLDIREKTKIANGRWFRAGQREVVVGKSIAKSYPDAALGKKLHFGRGDWEVVGVMDSNSSATNSEIYADLNQMAGDFNRQDGPSSALVRATDSIAAQALINSINDDQRLNCNARTEVEYMESQTNSAAPVQYLGVFVAIIMAVGSSFAAMNTMYAAVARRAKEVGTLRVLGFSRGSILTSFFWESVLLSLLGGALGCLLALPLNFVSTSMMSFTSFSEIAFNFHAGPAAMALGMIFAVLMGAIGGVFPARMAARKEILAALRDI